MTVEILVALSGVNLLSRFFKKEKSIDLLVDYKDGR